MYLQTAGSRRVAGKIFWFVLGVLTLQAVGSPLEPESGISPFQVGGLCAYLGLAALVSFRGYRKGGPDSFWTLERFALLLLLIGLSTHLTGGIRSPLLSLYPIAVLLVSLRFGLREGCLAAALSLLLEGGDFIRSSPPREEFLLYPLLLFAIPFAVRRSLDALQRERHLLKTRIDRIEGELAFLEEGPGVGEDPGSNPSLSQEQKEGEILFLARQMKGALEGALRVAYEALCATPPAFTSSSSEQLFAASPQVHAGLVLLYDQARQGFWLAGSVGPGEVLLKRDQLIALKAEGSGPLGWFMKEKKTLSVSNFDRRRGGPGYYARAAPVASLLVVPLAGGETIDGLLCFDSLAPGFFSEYHERILEGISQEIVNLLRLFRERQRVLRTVREVSVLLEVTRHLGSRLDLTHRLVTMAGEAQRIVPYDQCFILLVEPGERHAAVKVAKGYSDQKVLDRRFALSDGLLAILVRNRQPLLFSDLAGAQRGRIFPERSNIDVPCGSLLGIPLIVENRVIGVVLFLAEAIRKFNSYHQHVLTLLCNHVAYSIAEAQLHGEVEYLATVDGLTGTFNHRRFQARLQEEFLRAQRQSDPFSLLMVDIDHFKKINDTYGHPAGDAVLRSVARTLSRLVRETDLVARYGGEEFAILLVKASCAQAAKLAERIREMVERHPVQWEGSAIAVTISIGAACYPEDADERAALIARADRALYASKHLGRNRVTLSGQVRS